jgi:CrcB protein
MTDELSRVALVAVGGGAGAVLRYAAGRWAAGYHAVQEFPWHTLGVNVVGSFVLGAVAVWCKDRPGWFLLLGTGLCGGFTTFSTFSLETLTLIEKGRGWAATGYVTGSVAAGLVGAAVAVRWANSG